MLRYIPLFLFIMCFSTYSQVTRVDYYTFTKNTVDTTNVRTYLLFDQKMSIFIWNSTLNKVSKIADSGSGGELKTIKKQNDTIGFRVFNSFKSDSIIVFDKIADDRFDFPESKTIKWEIYNAFKTIGNLKCQQAKTNFRGRPYIVWFTEQIPIPAGPWKLNGLPGLILEAKDSLNEVNFTLKSIKSNIVAKEDLIQNYSLFEKTTLKDFVNRKDNYAKDNLQEILSKLPRGVEAKILESSQRNGIEKKYEWEQ